MRAKRSVLAPHERSSQLRLAAKAADVAALRVALASGADPNEIGWNGTTALHIVAGQPLGRSATNRLECLHALIQAGAEVTIAANDGSTPLHAAAWALDPEAIVALYYAGADLLCQDASGMTVVDVCLDHDQNDACLLALRAIGTPIEGHECGHLTMRQASIKAGLTGRLNHLLDHGVSKDTTDDLKQLYEFAKAHESAECAALLSARMTKECLAQISTICASKANHSAPERLTWPREAIVSAARAFRRETLESHSPVGYKSREKLIELPIATFLGLCRHEIEPSKLARTRSITRQGLAISDLPFLQIAPSDSEPGALIVDGHEGRHRARALAEIGFETMPVILRAAHIRWSEQIDPGRFDYKNEWPAEVQAQPGAKDQSYSIAMPVSRVESAKPYPLLELWPSLTQQLNLRSGMQP